MKEDLRVFTEKYRVLGVVVLLIIVVSFIFFSFWSQREKKNVSFKLKLFYSDMFQTIQYSVNNNGPLAEWSWDTSDKDTFLNDHIINYLRVSKKCLDSQNDCFPQKHYFNLNGLKTNVNLSKYPSVVLQNGISVAFKLNHNCSKKDSVCAFVFVDINGKENPNKFGKDLFVFVIENSEKIPFTPFKHVNDTYVFLTDKKYGCNKYSDMPMYCAAYLFTTNWSIDSRYPW